MLGVIDLPTYLAGLILIILLPGPNSLYVLSVGARLGVRAGYRAAGGVLCGDAVLMTLSAAGVASLLRHNPMAFSVLKFVGAGYLGWLAYAMLRSALGMWAARRHEGGIVAAAVDAAPEPLPESSWSGASPGVGVGVDAAVKLVERPMRRALVISLLNPKAILFFVAFFVQFVDTAYAYPALSFLMLGAMAQTVSVIYLSTLIFAGSRLALAFQQRRALSATATSAVGVVFLGFAAKLSFGSI